MTIGDIVNKILANNLSIKKADIARHINENRANLTGYLKSPNESGYRHIDPIKAWEILLYLNATDIDKSNYLFSLKTEECLNLYVYYPKDKLILDFINKKDEISNIFKEWAEFNLSDKDKNILEKKIKLIYPPKIRTKLNKFFYPNNDSKPKNFNISKETITAPFHKKVDFIIEIQDDSLSPIILKGSIAGVTCHTEIFPNKPMLVSTIDENGYTYEIKYIKQTTDYYELTSLNQLFKKNIPIKQLQIIGKVSNFYKKF